MQKIDKLLPDYRRYISEESILHGHRRKNLKTPSLTASLNYSTLHYDILHLVRPHTFTKTAVGHRCSLLQYASHTVSGASGDEHETLTVTGRSAKIYIRYMAKAGGAVAQSVLQLATGRTTEGSEFEAR
jgi:hypothetical protein